VVPLRYNEELSVVLYRSRLQTLKTLLPNFELILMTKKGEQAFEDRIPYWADIVSDAGSCILKGLI